MVSKIARIDCNARFAGYNDLHSTFADRSNVIPLFGVPARGNRSLLFRDPDGRLVNFFTPVAEDA